MAASIVLVSCFGANAQAAELAVDKFHSQMNAGAYNEIYSAASDEFKRATQLADWTALLNAVRRKLGTVVQAKQTSVHATSGTFGDSVSQTYSTHFSDGDATELFNWAIRDSRALLVGYRIESQQLITR